MSPEAIAADHVYRRLKSNIMAGYYAPFTPLNVHQIAVEIGVSISPVRDTMERLVGERLITLRAGGGFQMPVVSEACLRDLYMWDSHLARGAVSIGATIDLPDELLKKKGNDCWADDEAIAAATAAYFRALGVVAHNEEYRIALHAAGERLHAARLREGRCIKDREVELKRLITLSMPGSESALREAISLYHQRRLRHLERLCEALYYPISPKDLS